MSKETDPTLGVEVSIADRSLGRSLRVVDSYIEICHCDGTASRVLACLNNTGKDATVNQDPTAREELERITKATRWCAQTGLNNITKMLTGVNSDRS